MALKYRVQNNYISTSAKQCIHSSRTKMETTCSCQYIKTDVPVNHNLKRKSELVKSGEFLLNLTLRFSQQHLHV